MVRTNSMASWVDRFVRRTQGIRPTPRPRPIIPRQNFRMLILLTNMYNVDSVRFCRFIIDNGFVNKNIDVYKTTESEENNLVNVMQRFYNNGYRFFITTHGSSQFKSLFKWLNTNKDVIYINSGSTVAPDFFESPIPSNAIRIAITDADSLRIVLYEILPNFKFALTPYGNIELYTPLIDTSENDMPFKYIVYIYEPSFYTTSYGENIKSLIENYEFSKEVIFVPVELDPSSNNLTDEAIYYLTFNTISSKGYSTSTERPIIFLNSLDPQSLLNRFTEKIYYDNYFITGDSFPSGSYTSKYEFKYAFSLISGFSNIGYKLSYNVDKTQSISTFILMIYNVCSELGNIFNDNISTNRSFVASRFLEKLKIFDYIDNNHWYDKYLSLKHIKYENDEHIGEENDNEPHTITYNIAIMKHKWNPDTYVVSVSPDYLLSYNNMTFTEPLKTYSQNLTKINSYKPNAPTILTNNDYDLFYLHEDMNTFKFFLNDVFTRNLPEKMFAKHYCLHNAEKYSIPKIEIDLPHITGYVSQNVYNLDIFENTIDPSLNLTIPEFSYNRTSSFYVINRNEYIPARMIDLSNITIPSFNVILSNPVAKFDLYFYNGNEVRMNNEISSDNFVLQETLNGYVNVRVHVDWLVIKKKYVIGDIVTVLANNREAIITSVSSNFYNLTIEYKDDNSTEEVTQEDIAPTGLLDEFNSPIVPL
jgi:hypothetical protein